MLVRQLQVKGQILNRPMNLKHQNWRYVYELNASLDTKEQSGQYGPHIIGKNPSSFSFHLKTGEIASLGSSLHSPKHLNSPALQSKRLASPYPMENATSGINSALNHPVNSPPGINVESPSRNSKISKESGFHTYLVSDIPPTRKSRLFGPDYECLIQNSNDDLGNI